MSDIDARVADATDRLADLDRALHDLALIRGRHTTPDGLITVLVDGNGALIELHLAETITTFPARVIGPMVAGACADAAVEAAQRRDGILAKLTAAFDGRAE